MRTLRSAAVGAGGALAAWTLGGWMGELIGRGPGRAEDLVALAATAVAALLTAWYAITAVALLLAELAGLSRRTYRAATTLATVVDRFGAPVLRRAAAVGVGAGLALGAAPATAGPGPATPQAVVAAAGAVGATSLAATATAEDDGVPLDLRPGLTSVPGATPADPVVTAEPPGRPAGGPASLPEDGETGDGEIEDGATGPSYVVQRGDSLWSITAAHLPPGACAEQIAAAWPRWYSTNRADIGADPDLIHPGQELLVPDPKDAS